MVLTDMFSLSDAEYASRIRTYSAQQLRAQLRAKGRQIWFVRGMKASSASAFLELCSSIPYLSTVVGELGSRRVALSNQKIRLLDAELQRRHMHSAQMRHAIVLLLEAFVWTVFVLIPLLLYLYWY
jgi:hypothetical protein